MSESAVILAALGIVASVVTLLGWLLRKLFDQNDKTLRENTDVMRSLSQSITKLSIVSEKQAKSIEHQEKATQEWQAYVISRFDAIEGNTAELLNRGSKR